MSTNQKLSKLNELCFRQIHDRDAWTNIQVTFKLNSPAHFFHKHHKRLKIEAFG